MRREYLPAIILYAISFAFFVASVVCLVISHYTWATWLLIGIAIMLSASSRLVNIGRRLREQDEREEERN